MTRREVVRIAGGLLVVIALGLGMVWRFSTHDTNAPLGLFSGMLENPVFHGFTMGTLYNVQVSGALSKSEQEDLQREIDIALAEVNRQMSTWDANSEISRFNHSSSTSSIPVSAPFAKVVARALYFSAATHGAFDPTLQPLLNLWGFGSEATARAIPSDFEIKQAKALIGWEKVSVPSPTHLQKSNPQISLDLGAIAKGYGVDAVARVLKEYGYANFYVEIGGEVVVRGKNPASDPWRIGLQYPSMREEENRLQGVLHISTGAIATSGDYRNYIKSSGKVCSHILDPRSGYSVLSDVASVSVCAKNCTDADAMATALFVMGSDEGIKWVEQIPDVDCLFLIRTDNGTIIEKFSSGFRNTTGYIPTIAD